MILILHEGFPPYLVKIASGSIIRYGSRNFGTGSDLPVTQKLPPYLVKIASGSMFRYFFNRPSEPPSPSHPSFLFQSGLLCFHIRPAAIRTYYFTVYSRMYSVNRGFLSIFLSPRCDITVCVLDVAPVCLIRSKPWLPKTGFSLKRGKGGGGRGSGSVKTSVYG